MLQSKMADWLPNAVETPVLICGELMHRTNRETKAEEEGLQFFVREAYPLTEGIKRFAVGLHVDFVYEDPKLEEKMKKTASLAAANPGELPMHINLSYANGANVKLELAGGVNPTAEFLASIGKVAIKDKWGLDAKSDIFAEPVPKFPGRGR